MTEDTVALLVIVLSVAIVVTAVAVTDVLAPAWEWVKDASDRLTSLMFGGERNRARFNEWANRWIP
ncbi:MAG: hypothetical protein K0S43_400 [Cellulosimicrobium sp.]|jgi:hypothetical protein|nr:hypothetical protein [Cellulosimicrobium sp.]